MFADLEFIGEDLQNISIDGVGVGRILSNIQGYYIELFTDGRFIEDPYPTEAEALFALRDRYLKKKYDRRDPSYERRSPSYDRRSPSYERRSPPYDRRNPPYDRRNPPYESV